METRIRLRVMGISYNQLQSGAYALILAQVGGPYRIPVVIGPAEAQSIAMHIEGMTPPRPLTHDLFVSLAQAYGVRLHEVFIHKFEDGIFSSELTFTDGRREIKLDGRTSDAIAIAIRIGCPIYTTPEILSETGFVMEETAAPSDHHDEATRDDGSYIAQQMPRYDQYTIEELERTLKDMINDEQYEEAAKINEILRQKRNNR